MWFRRRHSREHDLDRELRAHLDLEAEEWLESGVSPDHAASAARRAFGNPTLIKEQIRELSPFAWLESLKQDVRYGTRMLKNSPGFTAVAICTLALGIGANTAIFSVVDATLLNPLPYPDAARLVVIWEQKPALGWLRNIVSAANFVDWKRQNHVFAGMAALSEATFNLSGTGEPVEVRGAQVSSDFFPVLGVRPARGRVFTPDDDRLEDSRVVVITHQLWQERYAADPALLGRQITVNRRQFTVIGILPPDFYFPPWRDDTQRAQLWVTGLDLRNTQRTWHAYESIAKLKPGVTFAQADANMETISRRLAAQYPEQKGWSAQLIDLHDQVIGDTRPALLVLLAAVGVVLLIACANLANLQLARLSARQKEIAVRAALGGGRFRVIRQLLTESVLLALAGGALGAALAAWGVKLFVALGPRNTPGLHQASVNLNVLFFTLVISVLTGIVFGLLPAFDASHVDLMQSFKESGRSLTHGVRARRLRGILVSGEVALALVLLTGAGLLIRSFAALSRVGLGFDPHHAMTVRVALQGQAYTDPARQIDFFKKLVPAVQALPGVTAADAVDGGGVPPVGGSGQDFLIENRPVPPMSDWPDGALRVVGPAYFRAMGIHLARGRLLTEADNEAAPRVAVINERLARDYWPGRDPIGSRIRFPGLAIKFPELPDEPRWVSIVGVVKDVKNRGLQVPATEEIYVPYQQPPAFYTPRALIVRAAGDPAAVTPAIRRLVQALDPNQPVSQVRSLDEIVALAESGQRFPMLLLSLFAALALVLAGVGIYGVMSYSITQRTHEIGVRMALGARSRAVIAATIAEAMRLAVVGVAFGFVASLALTRLVSALLFGVGARDPLTLLTVSSLLLAISLCAALLPARRASRVDPIVALRYE